jgi:eukaryotic-like serine/threonine-protein kinase
MTPTPGSRLGPYEIVARLGAGGMGEVYRARDSRLGREVALKVLPPELANDTARRARFEQEARAAAALNHANIMAVYDIGTDGGVGYMVTELVAGETLEAVLERGPVPIRKLLDIAVQIAEGMACAHAARITHRDLKPANVMITGPESGQPGRAKILDFGLAKQAAPPAVADETVAMSQTEPGMIMGTVNYMSPEQARGKPADYRSDQFSFGIILYEMASGKKPFTKPETVQTMSAILAEEPPPIEANIPAPLGWTIERCLAKDPADRFESTRDLYQGLRSLRDHLSEATGAQRALTEASAPSPRRPGRWPIAAAFVAGLLVVVVAALALRGPQTPDQSMYRFTPFSFDPGGNTLPVWAPDGKSVAYAAKQNRGPYQVFLRALDSPSPVQITHTMEDTFPSRWTPDGQRILLNSQRKPDTLWSVSKVGGEPEAVMTLPPDLFTGDVSPDNKAGAMLAKGKDGQVAIWISAPLGTPPKPYVPAPFTANEVANNPQLKFSPDGKSLLLFINLKGEEAWLLPYPPDPSHPPRQIWKNLVSFGTPEFSWMPDSRHVVLSLATVADADPQLWMADTRSNERYALTSGTASHQNPAVSPDGRKLIFGETAGNYDIVSVDLATATAHRMMSTERNQTMPAWAAKAPLLAYVTNRNGPNEIWLHSPTGADRPLVMLSDFPTDTAQWFMGPAMSPDGNQLIYAVVERNVGAVHLWISAVASRAVVRLTNAPGLELPGAWSPDGNWFAYLQLLNGKTNLMKVKTTGQASPVVLHADVGDTTVPAWSPTGEWIAYGGKLISPDGATKRSIGDHKSPYYTFSSDGKLIYGIRQEQDRELLFSVDIATGAEKIMGDLGKEFKPGSNVNPSIRFSMAPDGKSFVYSAGNFKQNLWMLEGFARERSFWSRLIP